MSILLSVSIALLAGLLMTRLFKPLKLPAVTAYLIAGVMVGPYALGRLHVGGVGFDSAAAVEALALVSEVALGFIAFSIGNEFRLNELKGAKIYVGEKEELETERKRLANSEKIITKADVAAFASAGADIILLPAPGTVPGITMEYVRGLVSYAHSLGCLTITAIGTSQEGADVATIRQIALMCKMTGTDIHHLGDSGYGGMALPENIQAYSIAVRGIRHTYRRMAASVNR